MTAIIIELAVLVDVRTPRATDALVFMRPAIGLRLSVLGGVTGRLPIGQLLVREGVTCRRQLREFLIGVLAFPGGLGLTLDGAERSQQLRLDGIDALRVLPVEFRHDVLLQGVLGRGVFERHG